MQTSEVELVDGLDILGAQSGLGCIGDGASIIGLGLPSQPGMYAVRVGYIGAREVYGELVDAVSLQVDDLIEEHLGREGHGLAQQILGAMGEHGNLNLLLGGGIYLEATILVDIHHEVLAGLLHDAQVAVGHEVLHKLLLLVGHEPSEVGLVLGVDACHEFYVGAEHAGCILIVIVGEAAVPRAAKVAIAPGPLFLAGTEVVAGHMEHAALGIVLVASLEVVLRVDGHVGGGHGDVLVVGDVDTGRVVHLIIGARGDGE